MAQQQGASAETAIGGGAVSPSFRNALPYFLSLAVFPLLANAAVNGSWWIAAPYLYFLIPDVFDPWSGADERNMDPRQTLERQLIWYKLSLWTWAILWPATFVFALWQMFMSDHLSVLEIVFMAFVLSVVAQVSFIVGHELIHRRAAWERRVGEFILASVSYPTYASEHIYVHHSLVCTPGDPGSAPKGVSYWRYLPREIKSNLLGAWRFEALRLTRRQRPVWHYTNPFWRYAVETFAWYALLYWLGGPWVVLVYAIICTGIILSMKLINYVQHYGLRRIRLPNGRYERVRTWHSWSSAYKLSNLFFYNMQRHPDHHTAPSRRYPLLQHCGDDVAPQLPGSYTEMASLAVFPKRWFRRMDPLVDHWRVHFYPEIDDWSAYDSPATAERPDCFEVITEIFERAPRLAAWIDRSPELLDTLQEREFADLDLPQGFGPNAEFETIARRGLTRVYWTLEFGVSEMRERIADYPVQDVRESVDATRNWSNDKAFQIGMHTMRGNLTPVEAGTALSNVAEASIVAVLAAIDEDFAGRGATGGLAAAVLGDLASRETAPGTELKVLLVYDGSPEDLYHELCRRIAEALEALSRDSLVFAPLVHGGSGIAACPMDDFASRFAVRGSGREMLDLTRARCVYTFGDAAIEQRFEETRRANLAHGRAGNELIAELRDKIGNRPQLDPASVDQERGGLAEVERAARLLQLTLLRDAPGAQALDAASVFQTAAQRALIPEDAAGRLTEAVTLWRNLLGIRRLIAEDGFDFESARPQVREVIARACGYDDFDALSEAIHETASRAAVDIEAASS